MLIHFSVITKMAASIYATPPPDLSSEDTALSDVSNTSSNTSNAKSAATSTLTKQLNSTSTTNTNTNSNTCEETSFKTTTTTTTTSSSSSPSAGAAESLAITKTAKSTSKINQGNSKQQQKRTINDTVKDSNKPNDNNNTKSNQTQCSSNLPNMGSSTNACHKSQNESEDNEDDNHQQQDTTASAMAAVAAAANAAMQLQLLEAINDAAKKRRKQHNPSRMDEDNNTTNLKNSLAATVDFEDKLSKMFLPKSMEQLKETFELLHQQQSFENISKMQELNDHRKIQKLSDMDEQHRHHQSFTNPYHTFCKECGENFENELKLNIHMLQEHNETLAGFPTNQSASKDLTPLDILASVKVKLERPDCESPSATPNFDKRNDKQEPNQLHNSAPSTGAVTNGKDQHQQQPQQQQQWMGANAINSVGFPFPPEAAAAAALQAGGYLPLLGMPGFPVVDGLNRPPLRIFNPEAFCELCNKEFCNKYFLKTHKANKHGIYDPSSDGLSSSQQQQQTSMNAMNQMFQLQMQQQHQHLQHQQQQQHQMQLELAQQKLLNEQHRKDHDNSSSISLTSATNISTKTSLSTINSQSQITPPAPAPVFCDICSKRFTNVFAMRRHRAKIHEQNSNSSSQRNSPSEPPSQSIDSPISSSQVQDMPAGKQFQMPEGFRQDFVLEQEEVSFTPQPRKLSPQLQQQAREANFSHDKLKRLGVTNPDTFCEICCKEYCNKYFLRTHKWKRHGILMPPEEAEAAQKLPAWPFMNVPGMPVNLMMAQHLMAGSEVIAGDGSQQPSKRIKLEQPDEVEETKNVSNDENQENRSENNQVLSVPSTPEPNKLANENQSVTSPETAMGLQNLQKLQTMIQQLNDFNGKRPVACHLCGRETENQYALQAHILAEHNGGTEGGMTALNFPSHLLMQQQALLKQSPSDSPSSHMPLIGMSGSGELRCTPCERDFTNLPEFQKHIAEFHLMTNTLGSPLHEGFATPERPINSTLAQGSRAPYTITPTSSYCEICNKELCNKYFMKTHMQRMHGIEIENGAQIGGVVCNICNKELCSKYFLRVHKHNTHGIIEDGAPLPTPRQNGLNIESLQQQLMESEGSLNRNLTVSPFGSGGSESKTESYSTSPYTEMCTICTRRFRNVKWLKNHLQSEHGSSGAEKARELEQQYGCSLSKPTSPTLKIPNGSSSLGSSTTSSTVPSPAQLAQALQNLNAQHLLQNMPKNNMSSTFNSEQPNLQPVPVKEYQCSLCPFSTPYYAFLFIHERTHSIINNNERENDQDEHDEPVYKREKSLESNEEPEEDEKFLKREPLRDFKTSTEIVALDPEEDFEEVTEVKQPEPENGEGSVRLSSPNEITSTTCREDLKKPNSPKNLLTPDKLFGETGDSKYTSFSPKGCRSTACSPIISNFQQQLLQDIAQKFSKPASFAVPHKQESSGSQMQAFAIEAINDDDESNVSNRFMPAIVYLPVKEPLTGSVKLSFNITPV